MRITPRAGSNIGDIQKEENPMIKIHVMRMLAGLTLLALVTAGCGTMTGAAVGAGSGAAIGAGTHRTLFTTRWRRAGIRIIPSGRRRA